MPLYAIDDDGRDYVISLILITPYAIDFSLRSLIDAT